MRDQEMGHSITECADPECAEHEWRPCPDCNGEGVISVMDASPNLDERVYECSRCADTQGMVQA